mgnify:CR=1 FL=1
MIMGKGDIIDLVLAVAVIATAVAISAGLEKLFEWYIMY